MEVGNEVKSIEGDGWPSEKFRKNICNVIDPLLARNRIMTPDLPVPDNGSKIEEYVFSKSTTKEEYLKSISNALCSLMGCSMMQIDFNDDGTRVIPEDRDFPSDGFRDAVVRTFETVYTKVGVPQPLTPQEEEQKLFDAYKTKEEYLVGFIDFLNSLREQQKTAMDAIREKSVDPVSVAVPEPIIRPRPPVVLKPIPGCPPMPTSPTPSAQLPPPPPMSELEARRSVFKRFANLFTVCVRKDGKDPDRKKK